MSESYRIKLMYMLKRLGLSSFEQNAFLSLLFDFPGEGTAEEISSSAGLPLGRVYSVMKGLERRKLISVRRFSNPLRYRINPPNVSLGLLMKDYEMSLRHDAESLSRLIDDFLRDFKVKETCPKPHWDVYHGDDVVYRCLIPCLLKASEHEVIIVGKNICETISVIDGQANIMGKIIFNSKG